MVPQESIYYNTLTPYRVLEHLGIDYGVCREFNHISRYKRLRQVIHNPDTSKRFSALETSDPISTNLEFVYYDVPVTEVNRLDIIANKFLGSAQYSWVISYFNDIEDGYTVYEGQRLRVVKSITQLFNKGELLSSIPYNQLNLGRE